MSANHRPVVSGTIPEPAAGLSSAWMMAAVVGGIWASVEIILGSFLHNLRIPFSGSILASFGIVLMVSFYQVWPVKGLIWRAGLICALMKSVSPSAVILGPMIGIFMEAILLQLAVSLLGNNLAAYMLGGGLSLLSALLHKIGSLLILYGFNIVTIYINIFHYASRQLGMENADPWQLINLLVLIYLVIGGSAAFIGYRIGRKVLYEPGVTIDRAHHEILNTPSLMNTRGKFHLPFFFLHILAIPAGLYIMSYIELEIAIIPVTIYLVFCILMYKRALARLRKPIFWIQLGILTLLAAVFWEGLRGSKGWFSTNGLLIGLEMNLRAIFVVIAFSCLSVELKNPRIRDFLFRLHFRQLYSAVEMAFGILPEIIRSTPSPRNFFSKPGLAMAQVIANAMTFARQIRDE